MGTVTKTIAMVQENISCIVFPQSICDFKEPASCLSHVDIRTLDDLHNDICLYAGPCMCGNGSNLEFDCSSELAFRTCPVVILPSPGNVSMEPVCKKAAGHGKLLMDVNIWTLDVEGNEVLLYSGSCYVMYSDDYSSSFQEDSSSDIAESDYIESDLLFPELNSLELNTTEMLSSSDIESINLPLIIEHDTIDPYVSNLWIRNGTEYTNTESENVLIDAPYLNLYNYDTSTLDYSMVNFEGSSTVSTVSYEEQDTYIIEDGSYEEATFYFPHEESNEEIIKCNETGIHADIIIYEKDEVESETTIVRNDKIKEKRRFDLEAEDEALKQLMSTNIQSTKKQRKIILFSGKDSLHGQTIQKISYNDPNYECPASTEVIDEVVIDTTDKVATTQKKYQCAKCHQIFSQLTKFKEHMTDHGTPRYTTRKANKTEVQFTCDQCGKKLKTKEKFEAHCLGHGDPERECTICYNVFASKFSLRTHMKIHKRKYRCQFCTKSYDIEMTLKTHTSKVHSRELSDADAKEDGDCKSEDSTHKKSEGKKPNGKRKKQNKKKPVFKRNAAVENDIISKAVSHEMFLSKGRKHTKGRKQCNVCPKAFDRISDLKRHLIEHTLTSTLRKNPVNKDGTLDIHCCLCDLSFNKIDKYKAHLRDHANLTTYTCTFCDKSFSDSSNFSKHKKIHGFTSFQCDLCQRKFNSKKMLVQHMEYHNANPPVPCGICDKVFHFESMLKKHVKSAHMKEATNRFRCKICGIYFKTLKQRWDHEWLVHNMRKMIVDCLVCGAKFRKYSELKRHCLDKHDLEIPLAKKMLEEG